MSNDHPIGTVIPVDIEDEMRTSYVDYAMSVIIGRAIPDVRDGLKPVHRRVLFAMHEQKNNWNGPYKKSARIVGDVIGKYHPHGDQAVYDTLVRMAQDFSMRYPLVDGQGNFGSVDGDPAAAMRYTEVRMTRLAHEMLADLEKDTVDFIPNYDDSTREPSVLPNRFPQLLVNGTAGIAVGMATNIPPHNLTEVVDATIALIGDPSLEIDALMDYVHGPDFPTHGFIFGIGGIRSAYETGRGVVRMRAKVDIEETKSGNEFLVISELPYQVNKARLVERIAGLVRDKRIEGIRDLRDESDRSGMRVVIELKRDATPEVVKNQLFAHTPLQSTFAMNMLAIVNGEPRTLSLKEMLQHFIEHRRDVVTRRCRHELRKAEERHHILLGYKIALDDLDAVIKTIRSSSTPLEARERLIEGFSLSQAQAQAILDLRLHRLTSMEREKIIEELREVEAEIARLEGILASDDLMMAVVVEELEQVKERFGDARRTTIVDADPSLDSEALIPDDDAVVTISHTGYIKRMPVSLFQSQHRGGKGRRGTELREEDFVRDIYHTSLRTALLVFTSFGKVYRLKVHQVTPSQTGRHRGKPIVQMIPVEKEELVRSILPLRSYDGWDFMFFVTARGKVKKTPLSEFESIRSNGKVAISLMEGDDLVRVMPVREGADVLLSTRNGLSIRFPEGDVRAMGRGARGVTGVRLRRGDRVVGADAIEEGLTVLTVTEKGYGKRSKVSAYRVQHRAGMGIITIQRNRRNGPVVGALQVSDGNDLLLITDGGQMIRIRATDIPIIGRNTMGVKLFNVPDDQRIVAVEAVAIEENQGEENQGEEGQGEGPGGEGPSAT